MTLWLLTIGFVSLLGQVVLLRELLVAFYGSELVILVALGVLMTGTAMGALAGRGRRGAAGEIRALFLVSALLLPLLVAFLRGLRVIFHGLPGADLPLAGQGLGLAAAALPFGACCGLLFQKTATAYSAKGRSLARAYSLESAGGVAGGALATLLAALGVQTLSTSLLCALAAVTAAWLPREGGRPKWLGPAVLAVAPLLAAALVFSGPADRRLTEVDHPDLLAASDTPYGRAVVAGAMGQIAVFDNGALAYESQGTSAEEFVQLAALQVARPARVLILGGAVEGLAAEVLKNSPDRVEMVELDGGLLRLTEPFLPEEGRRALGSPRVHLRVGDPRRALERTGPFDLILNAMPEPSSGQANRYYTREFFGACRARLAPGGVLAFRLRSAENLWSPALAARNASICRAAREAFGDLLVLPGTVNLILASASPLVRDPEVLAGRLEARAITARLVSPGYIRYLLNNDRVAEIAAEVRNSPAPENTDARPVCYPVTLLVGLSRFIPRLGLVSGPESPGPAAWVWVVLPGGLWAFACALARRAARWRGMMLVAVAGFSGMVLEGAVLLGYQTQGGILFQDMGLLLCAFMAGLSAGAWVLGYGRRKGIIPGTGTGLALLLGTALLAALAASILGSGGVRDLPVSLCLLALSGAFVGALFAYASSCTEGAGAAGSLYAADVLGGALGAVLGGLVILPFLGLPEGALLAGFLALGSVPLLQWRP